MGSGDKTMLKAEIRAEIVQVSESSDREVNSERIMRTQILKRFVIKSFPTDVPVANPLGQFRRRKRRKKNHGEKLENFELDIDDTVWLL